MPYSYLPSSRILNPGDFRNGGGGRGVHGTRKKNKDIKKKTPRKTKWGGKGVSITSANIGVAVL